MAGLQTLKKYLFLLGLSFTILIFCGMVYQGKQKATVVIKQAQPTIIIPQIVATVPITVPVPEKYVISNQKFCVSKQSTHSIEVVIIIESTTSHFANRQELRQKLAKEPMEQFKAHYLFILGLDEKYNLQVTNESDLYKDIIQGAFIEKYENLMSKSTLILHWIANYCSGIKYAIKMDEDMVFNLSKLFHYMTDFDDTPPDFIMGQHCHKCLPIRNPKSRWYVSKEQYPNNTWPDFVFGGAYMLHGNVAQRLWDATLQVPYLWLEDVYITGICREAAGIKIKYSKFPFFCRGRNPTQLMKQKGCPFVHRQ